MRSQLSLAAILSLGILAPVDAQTAQTFPNTLPASYAGNSWPFNNTTAAGFRTQFIYEGTSMISHKGPILIQRIRMRRSSGAQTATQYNVTVSLSTSPVKWNALTNTFANHIGNDVQVIHQGTLNYNATAWYFDVTLKTPFLYDPAKGDLCFDFVRGAPGANTNSYPGSGGYTSGNATAPFHANRIWGPPTAATGSLDSATTAQYGYANTAEITYIPASGLHSSFTATPTSGPGPLKVQFTDTTYTSNPPVKSWAWDFDGDKKIDSTAQNPSWTFPKTTFDATYDVTLTTTDGTNPPSTVTVPKFVTVDPSTASASDFGTGSINQRPQTPIELPPNSGFFNAAAVRGFFFTAPTTLVITGFEVPNDFTTKQTDQTVTCYVLPTAPPQYSATYSATAADVKFHGTGKADTILRATTPVIVQKDQIVGVLGACHTGTGGNNYNSYGAGAFPTTVLNQKITLNRMLMQVDHRTNKGIGPISAEGTSAIARVWIHVAGNTSAKVPELTTTGLPVLGQTPSLEWNSNIGTAQGGILLMTSGRLPTPVPVAPFGNLLVRPPFFLSLPIPGKASLPVTIPNDAGLTGIVLDWQAMGFDLGSSTFGLSNGTEWYLGKQ